MFKTLKSRSRHSTCGPRRSAGSPLLSKNHRRARLCFETLEDRLVLSTLAVTSDLDDGSAGTLRSVIAQVNSDGAQGIADSVVFEAPPTGWSILLQGGAMELTSGAAVSIWSQTPAGHGADYSQWRPEQYLPSRWGRQPRSQWLDHGRRRRGHRRLRILPIGAPTAGPSTMPAL